MAQKRLDYLDMVKGIGIILVVLGHIVYTEQHVMVWISSFHMPLFFVVAGVLMAIKGGEVTDLKGEILHRAKGLLIPYMWFSIIDFVLDIGNVTLHKIDMQTFITNTISSITFYGKSVLWFLTALFLAQVYFLILRRFLSDKLVVVMILIITLVAYGLKVGLEIIYNQNLDSLLICSVINFLRTFVRAGVVLPFLGYGYYIWKLLMLLGDSKSLGKIVDSRLFTIVKGLILLAVNITCAMLNWAVDTNNMVMGNPALYYIGGFAGSFALIFICKSLPSIRPLIYLGRNSLIIMATHLDCYILWAGLKLGMIVYGITGSAFVFVGLSALLTLCFCIVPIELINRFFPFIIGKKRMRNAK